MLLTLDMTETFRPSELFALRWSGFDIDNRTITVSQTAFRGRLRDYGKTRKSLRTVHLPDGLANELWLWKQECPDASPDAFIFSNARKRNGAMKNGFIRTDNYRARVLKKLAEKLGLKKLNFQVLRRTIATLAQTKGNVKDVQDVLGHSKPDITAGVYMQTIEGRREADAGCDLRRADSTGEVGGSFVKAKNLVRFGTVGVLDGPQVIDPQGLGA